MVHFSKLKLYGFKSFVDKTELEIGSGLNGIVGPNGCGKSNLVEALRWVMGEKSAKNMRGGGMEDVIFAGTSKRPARNVAEVTIVMNNEDGTAPAPFNNSTEIEINRRIEKDKGSQFRVNGRAVRARDVNLLFADTMTGATSPALVSQGKITEIISAKPSDRRRILEESAGISGLHTRRHEAELRLKAAEQNLVRLDDVLNEMRSRLSSLKRQSKQAERYRELSEQIRKFDIALSWSEWNETYAKIKAERLKFSEFNEIVQQNLIGIKLIQDKITVAETELPNLRKNQIEASAVLQNFRLIFERLEQDVKSKQKGFEDSVEAKKQLERDNDFTLDQYSRVVDEIADAENERERLNLFLQEIPVNLANAEELLLKTKEEVQKLTADKQKIETEFALAQQTFENLEAQENTILQSLSKIDANIVILNEAIVDTQSKIAVIQDDPILLIDLLALSNIVMQTQNSIQQVILSQKTNQEKTNTLKTQIDSLSSNVKGMQGELIGLQSLLKNATSSGSHGEISDPLMNCIHVQPGYEKCVSSVLGNWLSIAGTDKKSSVYWKDSNIKIKHPEKSVSLSTFVKAPDALSALINSVGVIDSLDDDYNLEIGQMVVTKSGSFKRWDGLCVKETALDSLQSVGLVLEYKNKIKILEKEIQNAQAELNNFVTLHQKAQNLLINDNETIEHLRQNLQEQEKKLADSTYNQARLKDLSNSHHEKLSDLHQRLDENLTDKKSLDSQVKVIRDSIKGSENLSKETQTNQINAISTQLIIVTQKLDDAHADYSRLQQSHRHTQQNIDTLTAQILKQQADAQTLSEKLEEFNHRISVIDEKITAYTTHQDNNDFDSVREEYLSKISDQDKILTDISSSLEIAETEYKNLQLQYRDAESSATQARENRAISQANVTNSESDLNRITTVIEERFGMTPQQLEEQTYSFFDNHIPSQNDLSDQKSNYIRQRDSIGPVNLRAEIESQETETQLVEMENEYQDLTNAIEQLRHGISKLNREAKDRLSVAFTHVNVHFQRLFNQLFEGGMAYLEMIESDDPLESGLEIFAQPPGKSLQKLSLLSGGEQTLTSIALIFGMFLTSPSPICVLDEIDAPLDDANVDRVCTLMETIARETNTRFIVITHHRMTMARMDRLYGVTMSERGVSQLVSVDIALQGEMNLAETA